MTTARYKQDKEALKKAIERQPDIPWPEEISEWDWPRRPTIEHLRKVLRGDYGYHPVELDAREPVEPESDSTGMMLVQVTSPTVMNFGVRLNFVILKNIASDSDTGSSKVTVGLVEDPVEVMSLKPRYSNLRTEYNLYHPES